ncbi:cobyrinic acid a,c-diamide synthase [Chloroherpeton thalassium ATCC 35110]|uniref:Cobyrinate a,c-diamide synthase n=1 Tax=Chloroherpeton thalassium (strain ATCC 35110 / GB-78) TaxID=517418 RepID=B3QWF1_CHLT3|nr:cobyrinate a,c-diamide synthase [Chloroherpeton thalassium]ACF13264.1 cobyrinic acid a,c-diamide synthase [Chloroherpeton thalassium ATCC 35110]
MQLPRFLIASPTSNSGKTTLALALIRAMSKRGLAVQPFKCGPDYLDTYLQSIAAASSHKDLPGINLDTFMSSKSHVMSLFHHYAAKADAVVVEGVMGLFDGAKKSEGSSAEIANLLGLPIVLVVNAKGVAYSVAPLLYGFKNFDPDLNFAGVIFNHVNTESHYQFLKDACADVGIEALGYVPHHEAIEIKERHLGLNISTDYDQDGIIEHMAEHVQRTVNLDRIMQLCTGEIESEVQINYPSAKQPAMKIAIAKDEAFNFIYHQNLEVLKKYGELVYFSPLFDTELPEADMLYIAGGYPELYLSRLSQNKSMQQQIAAFCEHGGLVYAECGGLMYLGKTIIDPEGARHPMCGFLDLETSMEHAKLTLGYRKVKLHSELFPAELRGHEFHYSHLSGTEQLENIADVRGARDQEVPTKVYRKNNTIASYVHLYWGEEHSFLDFLFHQLLQAEK